MNTKKYNLGIWVVDKTWHIIKINKHYSEAEALCSSKFDNFIIGKDPKWIYPYYIPGNEGDYKEIPTTKKTLCKKCLKLSKLSWNDIVQYLINIKVGAINAEESQIRKNKITPNIQKFKR